MEENNNIVDKSYSQEEVIDLVTKAVNDTFKAYKLGLCSHPNLMLSFWIKNKINTPKFDQYEMYL
jgi:hypothetical protein